MVSEWFCRGLEDVDHWYLSVASRSSVVVGCFLSSVDVGPCGSFGGPRFPGTEAAASHSFGTAHLHA